MRRTWFNRSWRGRRESRASRTPADRQRRKYRALVLVSALLALALWAMLTVQVPAFTGILPGSPSPIDVRARRTVTFVSELATAQERIRAESSPEAVVYTRDPNIPLQQRDQLADLLQTIDQIRVDPSLGQTAQREKLASLPLPNSTLVISPSLAAQLIRLAPEAWMHVRQETLNLYDRAMGDHNYELRDQDMTELRERSLPYWASLAARGEQRDLILLLSSAFIRPNRIVDEPATQQRKQALRDAVQPVKVTVLQGENIVHAGDIVTPAIQEKLEAIGVLQTESDWLNIGGKALLAVLVAWVFERYLFKMQRNVWIMTRPLLVVAGLFALTALAARLTLQLGDRWPYAFPLAVTGLLLATLFPRGLALMVVTLISLLIAFMDGGQAALATALLLGSMAGILTIGRGERALHFVVAGLIVALVTALVQIVFWLTTPGGPMLEQWLPILIYSCMNGGASAIFALGLYNLVGHLADVTTPQQLMELAHPNHPLLRKLIREAPGTYYHSVAVGNLAESAAEAIGADALLLRVASYYHDIGKTIRPYFFTDNQSDRENVHNDLDPKTSAEIICEHVIEGARMARAAGLPRQVVEFIPAHHGTSVIKHFYQIALQQQDTVDEEDYRYPGPKPSTREQAIMMLADSVEATVRSKAQHGKIASARDGSTNGNGRGQNGQQTLEELVNTIVDERIRSGQLDESNLTLQDVARIRQAFVNTLQGIYHPRVDYAPQVVKPS
ncbi:MAG TPA: HDIG domain-containing protein [Roseiflexaceae bacterium]|nr:HDIG domain-containing protein [Roseiflexaceae bacterium]